MAGRESRPGTGPIRINGALGELLRIWGPLTTVVGFGIFVQVQLARMPAQWNEDIQDVVQEGQLPVADQRLTDLERDVEILSDDVKEVLRTVTENKTAIQLLLEDRR